MRASDSVTWIALSLLVACVPAVAASPDEPVPQVAKPAILIKNAQAVPPANAPAAGKSPTQAELDLKALEAAGLKPNDLEGLLKYLKLRTLNDTDLSKIQALIAALGNENFEERLTAEAKLEAIGLPAIAPLKQAAANDANSAEIVYRAKSCLKRMEKVPTADVATAVVRALAKLKGPEVVPALVAYIPLADSASVSEEIAAALTAAAVDGSKANPVLVEALKDSRPARRSLALVALVNGTPAGQKLDALDQVLAAAKAETDKNAKFEMAKALILKAKNKVGVDLILDTIPDLNRGQIWQLEDLLAQIADKDAPKDRFMKKDTLVKAQNSWKAWWGTAKVDLEKIEIKQRILGRFVTFTQDYRFGQQGVITEYDAEEKERWKMTGLLFPSDAVFVGDRVWVADQNASQVTERDLSGKVLSTRKFDIDNGGWKGPAQPIALQLLTNGNLLVVARNGVCEFDKEGKEVMKYSRTQQMQGWGNQDVVAARKLSNGQVAMTVMNNGPNGQNPQMIFIDDKGKEIKVKDDKDKEITKFIKTGYANNYGGSLLEVGKDRVLIGENNQIAEYDLTTGKTVWTRAVNNARCLQRLPNGNTLYIDGNIYPNRAVEITPEGTEVWSFRLPDQNVQLYRVMIR